MPACWRCCATSSRSKPPQTPGSPAWLPQGYLLEYGPGALILHRAGGSFVAAFTVGGYTGEAIRRTAEEDHRGWPAYCAPDEYAYSVRRMGGNPSRAAVGEVHADQAARARGPQARPDGQGSDLAAAGRGEGALDRIASEDRRRTAGGPRRGSWS